MNLFAFFNVALKKIEKLTGIWLKLKFFLMAPAEFES